MQGSGTTDDLDPGERSGAGDAPTVPLAGMPTNPTLPLPVSSGRDRCGACGAPLAPDQRYCVECGQRRGQSRVEFMEQLPQRQEAVQLAPAPRRFPRVSANAALIAGVGTLMLAMGVGVLIGRSAVSEKGNGTPVKVITVGGGTTGTTATGATTPETGSTVTEEASKATGSSTTGSGKSSSTSGGGSSTSSKSASKSAPTKTAAESKPKVKVVKIGSKGSGRGYNKKKEFTGEFFGKGE